MMNFFADRNIEEGMTDVQSKAKKRKESYQGKRPEQV